MILTTDLVITEELETTRTYKVTDSSIQGYTVELEALKQAIYKVLNTEKYEHPIYSFEYGIELESLIGQDPLYVRMELKRRITEFLLQDDRVSSVENFTFNITGDEMLCTFDVISIYGELSITKEVMI